MSDVFNGNSIGFPAHWTDNQVRYADNAIKNHDKLTGQNQELIEMLEKTKLKLLHTANELNYCIDRENAELARSINSTDLDDPDYYDAQTVHEAMVQAKHVDDLLAKVKE